MTTQLSMFHFPFPFFLALPVRIDSLTSTRWVARRIVPHLTSSHLIFPFSLFLSLSLSLSLSLFLTLSLSFSFPSPFLLFSPVFIFLFSSSPLFHLFFSSLCFCVACSVLCCVVSVCVLLCGCVVVCCVLLWYAENHLCVDSSRLRVYIQNVSVSTSKTSTCLIHVDVVPVHTETF